MGDEERNGNGIKTPKDSSVEINVYIYNVDLNVEKPIVKKFPAKIRTGLRGDNEVIYWASPIDYYRVWHSEFDIKMLGVVYMPLNDVIELITKRDDSTELENLAKIEGFCATQIGYLVKRKNIFHKGISAVIKFSNRSRRLSDYLIGTEVSTPLPGPFEGEEDI